MRVRPEELDDRTAVHAVNEAAFGTSAEADLVDALRGRTRPLISLVAEEQGAVVGHILFSPVSFPDQTEHRIMGLVPMAVVPEYQRKGIGSALVREGLKRCEDLGCGAIVVVGHPEYYPRFGFLPASRYGITCEYDVPDDAFMVLELQPGFFHGVSGQIRYDELFNSV